MMNIEKLLREEIKTCETYITLYNYWDSIGATPYDDVMMNYPVLISGFESRLKWLRSL